MAKWFCIAFLVVLLAVLVGYPGGSGIGRDDTLSLDEFKTEWQADPTEHLLFNAKVPLLPPTQSTHNGYSPVYEQAKGRSGKPAASARGPGRSSPAGPRNERKRGFAAEHLTPAGPGSGPPRYSHYENFWKFFKWRIARSAGGAPALIPLCA